MVKTYEIGQSAPKLEKSRMINEQMLAGLNEAQDVLYSIM